MDIFVIASFVCLWLVLHSVLECHVVCFGFAWFEVFELKLDGTVMAFLCQKSCPVAMKIHSSNWCVTNVTCIFIKILQIHDSRVQSHAWTVCNHSFFFGSIPSSSLKHESLAILSNLPGCSLICLSIIFL